MADCEFAKDSAQAEEKAKQWRSTDPFPDIVPALLNSADIYRYVQQTAMLFPFDSSPESLRDKLKSASYEIDFLGEVRIWSETQKPESPPEITQIERDSEFWVPKNSIVFVSPRTEFRLPEHIGLRFNLRIKHVHRGLLLGTGPLVDPGFCGKLFIPLHNLTSEDYLLVGGEGLIWVEFTKLSPHRDWDDQAPSEPIEYKRCPKKGASPEEYIRKASGGKAICSSIPGAIADARRDAKTAKKTVQVQTAAGVISILLVLIGLFSLGFQLAALIRQASAAVRQADDSVEAFRQSLATHEAELEKLRKQLDIVTKRSADGIVEDGAVGLRPETSQDDSSGMDQGKSAESSIPEEEEEEDSPTGIEVSE